MDVQSLLDDGKFEADYYSNGVVMTDDFADWDFSLLQDARRDDFKKFKAPWVSRKVSGIERGVLQAIHDEMHRIFTRLCGHLGPPKVSQFTYRPEITGPEPLHFDKEEGEVVTAFLNWDSEPRQWRLGPTRQRPGAPYSLPDTVRAEEIEFPPNQLWIFRAETVSHQVVHGRGAVQFNWHLL
jgi:hypothetical protein